MSWKKAYLESRILSASPLELVALTYEHTLLEIDEARTKLAEGDVAGRSKCISKAIALIGELEGALDYSAGGEMAANLGLLYRYMREKLMEANIRQMDALLSEVRSLIETLADSWRALSEANSAAGKLPGFGPAEAYEPQMSGWSL